MTLVRTVRPLIEKVFLPNHVLYGFIEAGLVPFSSLQMCKQQKVWKNFNKEQGDLILSGIDQLIKIGVGHILTERDMDEVGIPKSKEQEEQVGKGPKYK